MKRTLLIIIMISVVALDLAAADRVVVFRFRGTGVGEELVDAVGIIFKNALASEGRYLGVNYFELLGDVECFESDCAMTLARKAGERYAITGHLTRLGYKIIVGIQLVDAEEGKILATEDGAADAEEDLDIVLKRLVRSISTGKTMEETAELGLLTENESRSDRRRQSFGANGFRVGFMWPMADSMGKVGRLMVFDFVYQYDTRDFFLAGKSGFRFGGGLDWNGLDAMDFAILDVKLGRYFSRNDFSPFVSAGIGVHWMKLTQNSMDEEVLFDREDSGSGLSLTVGTGFAAFRTYDFQFQLDLDYFIIFEHIGLEESSSSYPSGVILTFCIKKGSVKD
ncbi:MAG: hypothetical protein KAV42_11270 [Candidatus Krumholzibacteria bacterium]|nr:hypothetical protein [Candidatus Krumholzibacteria bacterium]